jgi:hypothetical protein
VRRPFRHRIGLIVQATDPAVKAIFVSIVPVWSIGAATRAWPVAARFVKVLRRRLLTELGNIAKVLAFAQVHNLSVVQPGLARRSAWLSSSIAQLTAAFRVVLEEYDRPLGSRTP